MHRRCRTIKVLNLLSAEPDMVSFLKTNAPRSTYPLNTNCYSPCGLDRQRCDRILTKESETLFVAAGGGITVLWKDGNPGEFKVLR